MDTPKFVIVLKNEKLKTYTVISWLIIALNFVCFYFYLVSYKKSCYRYPPLLCYGSVAMLLLFSKR